MRRPTVPLALRSTALLALAACASGPRPAAAVQKHEIVALGSNPCDGGEIISNPCDGGEFAGGLGLTGSGGGGGGAGGGATGGASGGGPVAVAVGDAPGGDGTSGVSGTPGKVRHGEGVVGKMGTIGAGNPCGGYGAGGARPGGASPVVRLHDPVVRGTRSPKEVVARLDADRDTLRACVERARQRAPALAGTGTLRVVIADRGTVLLAAVTDLPADVARCLSDRVSRLEFKPLASKGVTQIELKLTIAPPAAAP